MISKGGGELRPDPEVVGGEAKALLRFELLRREFHVGDARIRCDVDGLALDSQDPTDLGPPAANTGKFTVLRIDTV